MKILFILLLSFLFTQDYSLQFDGDDYVDISNQNRFSGIQSSFSVSFWIKPTSFDGWGSVFLFRKHNMDHYLNVDPSGSIRFGLSSDSGYEAINAELIEKYGFYVPNHQDLTSQELSQITDIINSYE